MAASELRRSSRVVISVPVKISGVDNRGQLFSEEARTVVVNRHGAMILSSHELKPGTEVELSAFQDGSRSRARVVRIAGRNRQMGAWEVATELSLPGNFWRINFPPEDWTDSSTGSARTEENSAGLRPRPVVRLIPNTSAMREVAPRVVENPAPAAAPPIAPSDPATGAIRAVEAAAVGPASAALISNVSPEDKLKRYQMVTGALLRALMRRGLLTEKELREALEGVEGELQVGPSSRPGQPA